MKIGEIRKLTGTGLQTISARDTVHQAAERLVEFNIGALPVTDDDGELVGIITERDILRVVAGRNVEAGVLETVASVMTPNPVVSEPMNDIEDAMHVMTNRRIRHLPIMVDDRLVDILSIGDVVKAKLDLSDEENRFLRDYVAN